MSQEGPMGFKGRLAAKAGSGRRRFQTGASYYEFLSETITSQNEIDVSQGITGDRSQRERAGPGWSLRSRRLAALQMSPGDAANWLYWATGGTPVRQWDDHLSAGHGAAGLLALYRQGHDRTRAARPASSSCGMRRSTRWLSRHPQGAGGRRPAAAGLSSNSRRCLRADGADARHADVPRRLGRWAARKPTANTR
jgi:hypothetical protein